MGSVLRHLLTPINVGPFELRNRIISTAHTTVYNPDGLVTDQEIAYHVSKARGGIALSVTGSTVVHPSGGAPQMHVLVNFDDSVIPGYRKLGAAMHEHGARMMVQLTHLASGFSSEHSGHPTWAPSQMMGEFAREWPHVMTKDEIDTVLQRFYHAAARVRAGELDGVELQAFAASLAIQFMSPYTNKRTDEYGGSLQNRLRFSMEMMRACREGLGSDRALSLKIAGDELVNGGLHLPEMQEIVRHINATGLIDFYVVASGNNMERFARIDHWPPTPARHNLHAGLAAGIREMTRRPVAALARIVDPLEADRLVADGVCDLVAMVRANIADPELPKKAAEGRLEDIRPCVGDSTACIDRIIEGKPMRCIYNPVVGREREWGETSRAPVTRAVLVIGGGPGGLEAARVAALRGHGVQLLERTAQLGGNAIVTARQPGREEMVGIPRWLIRQVHKLGVKVRLNTEATPDLVREERPDVVIMATGATATEPVTEAIEADLSVVSAWSVLSGAVQPGRNVLVIDHTGRQVGCAVAELVTDRGGKAEVVSRQFHPAIDFGLTNTVALYRRLFRKGVELTAHHDLRAIRGRTAVLFNYYNERERTVEGLDTVVIVTSSTPNHALLTPLSAMGLEVHAIGDCVAPRDIEDAVYEGHRIAWQIGSNHEGRWSAHRGREREQAHHGADAPGSGSP
jgi:2,4-dienoyl-CoA reductase-like NADH-dependent reductase (Old Yellow Enzyme family)/thioredoxin reductase